MAAIDSTATFIDSLRPAGSKRSGKRDLIVNVFLRQQGLVDHLDGRAVGAEPDGAIGGAVDLHGPQIRTLRGKGQGSS